MSRTDPPQRVGSQPWVADLNAQIVFLGEMFYGLAGFAEIHKSLPDSVVRKGLRIWDAMLFGYLQRLAGNVNSASILAYSEIAASETVKSSGFPELVVQLL